MRARSHHRRNRQTALPVLAIAVVILAVMVGCESSPTRQHQGNPFDPAGDTGGDALQVGATIGTNKIFLTWQQPQDLGITEYVVFHGNSRDGTYEQLATVNATTAAQGSYTYEYPDPTRTHWFKVQARNSDGGFSLNSLAVAAAATMGPTVVVGDTVTSLATRFPEFTVTATLGDSLLVGQDEDFTNAWRFAQTGPGLPTVFSLDLGPAAATDTFRFYVKAFDANTESAYTELTLPVRFQPTHTLVDASANRLATRVNDLAISSLGVIQMRFAASEAGLATAAWVPGADVYPGYELSDSANAQEIWGEYEGDFGFTSTRKLTVRPDLLTSATFQLNLPSNRIVSTPIVTAQLSAAATEVRISENPDFSLVPWRAFTDTTHVQLSAGEGTKTVYCQYRNDWTESAILSDYCIFISQGMAVKIIAPAEGNVIPGGADFVVSGISDPGTVAAAVDSVKLDLGDGLGFRPLAGTTDWQMNWAVPTYTEDTERVIRARAWADTFMVTDAVTVTISQLTIQILAPAAGDSVVGGDPLTISGNAQGRLNGAPVDSVTVSVAGEHLLADGTDTWTASWDAPVVTTATPTDITATVWAAGESASQTIAVTLTPAALKNGLR